MPARLRAADACANPGPYGNYNCWAPIGVTFGGTAKSVNFGGSANYIGFDNVTLGSEIPGSVPDPASTLLLLGAGLASVAAFARYKRR